MDWPRHGVTELVQHGASEDAGDEEQVKQDHYEPVAEQQDPSRQDHVLMCASLAA